MIFEGANNSSSGVFTQFLSLLIFFSQLMYSYSVILCKLNLSYFRRFYKAWLN